MVAVLDGYKLKSRVSNFNMLSQCAKARFSSGMITEWEFYFNHVTSVYHVGINLLKYYARRHDLDNIGWIVGNKLMARYLVSFSRNVDVTRSNRCCKIVREAGSALLFDNISARQHMFQVLKFSTHPQSMTAAIISPVTLETL